MNIVNKADGYDTVLEGRVLASVVCKERTAVERRQMFLTLKHDMFRSNGLPYAALGSVEQYYKTYREVPDAYTLSTWPQCPGPVRQLLLETPEPLDMEGVAGAVRNLEMYKTKRKVGTAGNKLIELCKSAKFDPDKATELIRQLSRDVCRPAGMSEIVLDGRDPNLTTKLRKLMAKVHSRNSKRWATGWGTFDAMSLGGVAPGEALLLAANTGGGKSMAALALAMYMAECGARVLYFSFEMSQESVFARLAARDSGFTRAQLANHNMAKADVETAIKNLTMRLGNYAGTIKVMTPDMGFARPDLEWLEAMILRQQVDVVFVDYMSMLRGSSDRGSTEEQRLREAAEGLLQIAAATSTAVIAMAQLTDGGEIKYARGIADSFTYALTWDSRVSVGKGDEGAYLIKMLKKREQAGKSPDTFWLQPEYDYLRITEVPGSADAGGPVKKNAVDESWKM